MQSFRRRTAIFLAIFNFALLIGGYDLSHRRIQDAEAVGLRQAQYIAQIVAHDVFIITEGVDALQVLAQRLLQLQKSGQGSAAQGVEDDLRHLTQRQTFHVFQVSIIDRSGDVVWSSQATNLHANIADREHFIVHREGFRGAFVSEPLVGRVSRRSTVQFTQALREPDGAFSGVIVVSVDPIQWSLDLRASDLAPEDVVVVYRVADGRVLARTPDPEAPLRRARFVAPAEAWRRGLSQRGAIDIAGPYSGKRRFVGYTTAPDWPIGVLVAVDAEQRLLGARREILAEWAVLLGASATSIAVYFWIVSIRRSEMRRERLLQTDAALRVATEAQEQLNRLLQDVNAVIYTATKAPDGRISIGYVSPNTSRVLGLTAADLTENTHDPPCVDSQDIPVVARARDAALREGAASADYRLHRPNGSTVWVNARLRVVARHRDGTIEMVNCLTDATDRRRLAEQAVATERVLALGQMASGLVHELSHPIVTILMSLETMIRRLRHRPPDLNDMEVRLCRSRRLADRAREVLLHLGQFGHVDPSLFTSINVRELIDGAVAACADSLAETGMHVHITVMPEMPAAVGIPALIEQVLVNLLHNACDAARNTKAVSKPAVWIDTRAVNGAIEISVGDNASGIPEAVLPHIFDLFYTTKSEGTGARSGMGLGLALARGYLRCQGGDLTAHNSGDGALFVLSLPVVGQAIGIDRPHNQPDEL